MTKRNGKSTLEENKSKNEIRCFHVGLADENHPMDKWIGNAGAFSIGIRNDGMLQQTGMEAKAGFGSEGFKKNAIVGCGIMMAHKTKNGEAAKCEQCEQKQRVIFFTTNGELWDNLLK